VFKVRGKDHLGEFEVFRRFKQFDLLRKVLFARFLGLYVPPIPEKKAMGNTDNFFVEERMHYLNKFMQAIARLPYLYESLEFATFLRPAGDLDACFAQLPPQNTESLLARLREVVPLNSQVTFDGDKVRELNDFVLVPFVRESQALLQSLTAFKNQMKVLVPIKEQEVAHYRQFVDFLGRYEEVTARS
jgi:sorting nexin-1/2